MQGLKDFFIFCSGANRSILKRTPTEVNKFIGIGATIFFTGVFAAIAGGYALSTVFGNSYITVIVALLWGFMIFNLDRFIVSTMKKKGSFWRDVGTATPRLILALLIAIVIAKPLELKIFESEINAQLVQMEQENQLVQESLIRDRYTSRRDSLSNEIAMLKQEINTKASERDGLVAAAIAEADGTGGSLQRNLGPIYKTKKAAADKAQSELDNLEGLNGGLIASKLDQIATLDQQQANDILGTEQVSLTGFAARLNGLDRAAEKSKAIYIANLFIMLLFIAIELAPVLTKLILERSPYDYVLDKHEKQFELNHGLIYNHQKRTFDFQEQFEIETGRFKTQIAIEAEQEVAREAIKEKLKDLKKQPAVWPGFFSKGKVLEV